MSRNLVHSRPSFSFNTWRSSEMERSRAALRNMVAAGKVRSMIDDRCPLDAPPNYPHFSILLTSHTNLTCKVASQYNHPRKYCNEPTSTSPGDSVYETINTPLPLSHFRRHSLGTTSVGGFAWKLRYRVWSWILGSVSPAIRGSQVLDQTRQTIVSRSPVPWSGVWLRSGRIPNGFDGLPPSLSLNLS